jgi:hypothetical protein
MKFFDSRGWNKRASKMQLAVHQIITRKGYITDARFLWGNIAELERKLGYHSGRLTKGFFLAHLLRIPHFNEFNLAGYSNTPGHRFVMPGGLDSDKLKAMARKEMMRIGCRRLVKIIPITPHDASMPDDEQYPPGLGVPQWELTHPLLMRIFQFVDGKKYGEFQS